MRRAGGRGTDAGRRHRQWDGAGARDPRARENKMGLCHWWMDQGMLGDDSAHVLTRSRHRRKPGSNGFVYIDASDSGF